MNIIFICYTNNKIFQEIKYSNINELNEKLINIINASSNIYVQLILNGINLNRFGIIDNSILSKCNNCDLISIVFIEKKEIYIRF